MSTIILFILVIIILVAIYIISLKMTRPREINKDEDLAYNKISLAREVVRKMVEGEEKEKFELEIQECDKLFRSKNYPGAERCAELVISRLRNFKLKEGISDYPDAEIKCPHCGTKLAKKYDFCPICGEKL